MSVWNLLEFASDAISWPGMPIREQKRFVRRPPRVSIPQQEPVTLLIGTKKISAGLHQVSVTGGVLQMPEGPIRTGFATIAMKTTFGPVSSPIEFLRTVPGKRNAMAFRFFHMYPIHHERLEQAIKQMCQQGFGEKQNGSWAQSLLRLAQKPWVWSR